MRIAVIGPVFPDSFADNIIDSFAAMGHEAISAGPTYPRPGTRLAAGAVEQLRRWTPFENSLQAKLLRRLRSIEPELVVTVEGYLFPGAVEKLQRNKIKVALWFPDAVVNLGRMLMFMAPYDGLFFKEPRLVERTRALMASPVHYLPEACNERWHRPLPDGDRIRAVVVAGNLHPYRVRQLERLLDEGIPLELYGAPLPRWLKHSPVGRFHTGRSIAREEKARIFRACAVVLNQLHPGEIDGLNCRLFEATGCGGAVVTEVRDELHKFFTPDREVLAYGDFDGLLAHVRRLLEDPNEGRALGDAASRKAHSEHTYRHRLERMLELVA